jgi:hypothetical protein
MTSEASTTTWETLVEQYRERAARDDARIEELRQSVYHWHDTAQMLKVQRDMAEQERDEWKIRAMASEQQRQALRDERDALRKVTATMEELAREAYAHWDNDADSKVGKCLVALSGATGLRKDLDRARDAAMEVKELGGVKAECEALRKDAARLSWLESRKSYSISNLGGMACAHLWVTDGEDVRVTKTVTKPTLREAIDAAMEVTP